MTTAINRRALLKAMGLAAGAGLSTSCRRALESGADLSAPPVGGTLSTSQLEMIGVLSDLILPETDTPGAVQAGVPAFIHSVVVDWYTPAEQEIFLAGLAELADAAQRRWSAAYVDLDRMQQSRLLAELEPPSEGSPDGPSLAALSMPPGASGELPFFLKLKELTVVGYYTSELAARTELDYQPVPGRYDGDARLSATGRQWVR